MLPPSVSGAQKSEWSSTRQQLDLGYARRVKSVYKEWGMVSGSKNIRDEYHRY